MSLIEDDKLKQLAKVANDALEVADRALGTGQPREVIARSWKALEEARDAYNAHKRELFHRHGGPIDPHAITLHDFKESTES